VFVPEGGVNGDRVQLAGPEAHYVREVLRLRAGGRFSAVLPTGVERVATVQRLTDAIVEAVLGEEQDPQADPQVDVRIRPGLVKARRLGFSGVELGGKRPHAAPIDMPAKRRKEPWRLRFRCRSPAHTSFTLLSARRACRARSRLRRT
jgi:hypothetical protein